MKATRAMELLERGGIPYRVLSYESDGFVSAVEAAARLGIPPETMLKTLIARGERRGVVLAVIPGSGSLSLRKLAQRMGDKRAEMVDPSEITRLTGYVKGGVSPLGGKRPYPVYLDRTALAYELVAVSAGVRGLALQMSPEDLVRATGAAVADLLE